MPRLQLPKSHLQGCDFVVINYKTLNFATNFFLAFDFVVINLKTLDFATSFFPAFDFVVNNFKPLTVFTCKQDHVYRCLVKALAVPSDLLFQPSVRELRPAQPP